VKEVVDYTDVFKYLDSRILTCYHEAKELMSGNMPDPRMAVLYPTYACNHNCIGCDYGQVDFLNTAAKPKSWTLAEGQRILSQVQQSGFSSIEWCGGGEPTLWPHLSDFIQEYNIEGDIPFGILTNGSRLKGKLADQVSGYGSYCRVSIESATEETFNRYKRPRCEEASFQNVCENVKNLVRLRDKCGDKLTISYKFALDQNNYRDLPASFTLARELGVDSLQLKPIVNTPTVLTDEQLEWCNVTAKQLIKDNPDVNVRWQIDKLTPKTPCWLCPMFPVIEAYGNVMMCCYFRPRYEDHCIGNLLEQDWTDIWGSPHHWDKLEAIKMSECAKYDCRYHIFNDIMDKLVRKDVGQFEFM
jgi:MoaA/NifB/PqqE/SkfB family radical SAM enzyme